jgi:GST-like protein
MIELHYWPTPNGHKITMFLEETGLAYRIVPVNIGTGAQFAPDFLAIAPNNRMPAIIDTEPEGGGRPLSVFESGAILLYLAEKSGQLLPAQLHARYEVIQWVFWQMAGLGPMAGQNHHFARYAPERLPYAITRYVNETNRLGLRIPPRRAAFSSPGSRLIADIAHYPWIVPHEARGQNLAQFPHLQRWFEAHPRAPGHRTRLREGQRDQHADHPHRGGQEGPLRADGPQSLACAAACRSAPPLPRCSHAWPSARTRYTPAPPNLRSPGHPCTWISSPRPSPTAGLRYSPGYVARRRSWRVTTGASRPRR